MRVHHVGFMQGRLSRQIDGKIQAFPWEEWRSEFPRAAVMGLDAMEWTLDHQRLAENPLLTKEGQAEIRALSLEYGVAVDSLTGDCFMQAPFWKTSGPRQRELEMEFDSVVQACVGAGIGIVVVPLVDNGRLDNRQQEDQLTAFLQSRQAELAGCGVRVAFESDYSPAELERFMARLEPQVFGVNYDIGNSASLGLDPVEEFAAIGHRIMNVHVKDRVLGGTTVPLGAGAADFEAVFRLLAEYGYQGNLILQTARATDDDHAGVLARYLEMTRNWMAPYAG